MLLNRRFSNLLVCTDPLAFCEKQTDFDSVGLGWGLRSSVLHKVPGYGGCWPGDHTEAAGAQCSVPTTHGGVKSVWSAGQSSGPGPAGHPRAEDSLGSTFLKPADKAFFGVTG